MAEEKDQVQPTEAASDEEQPKEEPKEEPKQSDDIEALRKQLDEMQERFKKETSGLNRRNSELERKLEEAEKEKMSEQERLEYEKKQWETEREKARQEAEEYRIGLLREKKVHEAGLGPEAVDLLTGKDEESIDKQIAYFKTLVDKRVKEQLEQEISQRFPNRQKPKAGGDSGELTYEDMMNMSEDEVKALGTEKVNEIVQKAAGMKL